MRASIIFAALILADSINPHWHNEYGEVSTVKFICWMIIIFFAIDIYEVIKK